MGMIHHPGSWKCSVDKSMVASTLVVRVHRLAYVIPVKAPVLVDDFFDPSDMEEGVHMGVEHVARMSMEMGVELPYLGTQFKSYLREGEDVLSQKHTNVSDDLGLWIPKAFPGFLSQVVEYGIFLSKEEEDILRRLFCAAHSMLWGKANLQQSLKYWGLPYV